MSERKVLNKYYPPDFDITKLPKMRRGRDRQFIIRIMAPMNMRCDTCGEYIYKGKKFNARQETVKNETYLGLKIFRFYIKCPQCVSEITFKTDPANTDYELENGATRNFQAAYIAEKEAELVKKKLEEENEGNPMKTLEKRTKESRMEIEILEKLEEIKDLNKRLSNIEHDTLLANNYKPLIEEEQQQFDDDEKIIKNVFKRNYIVPNSDEYVELIEDEVIDETSTSTTSVSDKNVSSSVTRNKPINLDKTPSHLSGVKVIKKSKLSHVDNSSTINSVKPKEPSSISLVSSYNSSGSD